VHQKAESAAPFSSAIPARNERQPSITAETVPTKMQRMLTYADVCGSPVLLLPNNSTDALSYNFLSHTVHTGVCCVLCVCVCVCAISVSLNISKHVPHLSCLTFFLAHARVLCIALLSLSPPSLPALVHWCRKRLR
jgi:hypothetical protein